MAYTVVIGTTTHHVALGSLSITATLGQIGTCELTLPDVLGTINIAVGQPISVTQDANIIFAGSVTDVTLVRANNNGLRTLSISAQDWNALPSRYTSGEYTWAKDTRLNNIVRDLVTNSPMNDDGVNLSMVPYGGGDLTTEVFNPVYTTVTDSFNALATLYKKFWKIDYTKTLTFSDWQAGIISAVVSDYSGNVIAGSIKSRATIEQYANYIIVRYSNFIKDFTQSFVGNGTQTDFSVDNPIASQPTVKVNGTVQTIGVYGTDTGKQCYWTAAGREITFTTAPASGASIVVDYRGRVIDVKDAIDAEGVSTMQALVGGSGVYEKIINVSDDTTVTDAQSIADRLLEKYRHISNVVTFDSYDIDSQVGDRITINVTGVVPGDYVVRGVRTYDVDGKLRRSFEVVTGNLLSDGFDAFAAMTGQSVLSGGTITLPPDTSSSTSGLASIGDNLLVNNDFESDLDGWWVDPNIASQVSIGTTGAKSGNKYLHLEAPMANYGSVDQYADHSFPVAAGDWYTIEFWVRANAYSHGSGGEGLSSPQMNFQSASGTYIGSIQTTIPSGTYDWSFFRVSGQVPTNATRASLEAVWGKLMNGTVDFDAIRMYKGAPSQQTVGANLLLNPDFERSLDEWIVDTPLSAYASIQTGGAKSGSKFLRIAGGQSAVAAVRQSYNGSGFYPIVEGQSFKFEGWYRTNSAAKASGSYIYTQCLFFNAAQTYIGSFVFSYPEGTASNWTHLTGHGVAPAGAVYMAFYAFVGNLASGSIDIDSLQLYFDDSTEKTPLDYGALGDGVTDDTLAVQAALNVNSTLKIPAGYTFLVNGLSCSGKTSPYIYGGGTLKQKASAPAGSSLLLVVNCTEPYIENLVLDGNKANQTNAIEHLLYFRNCAGNITADAVTATNGKTGGILTINDASVSQPSSVTYTACTATGCTTTGLGIQNSATAGLIPSATITDCVSTGNGSDGVSLKRITDITVNNTQSTGNTGWGVKSDACNVRFSYSNVSGNTAGAFSALNGSTWTAYDTTGLSDQRNPIAPPPPVASLSFTVTDQTDMFGFAWGWTLPTITGTAMGTVRQVRYWTKVGGAWTLDSDWMEVGNTSTLATLTASDGPFGKRSGEFQVEGRICLRNFEGGLSAWVTSLAPIDITALPIDSSLDNVNLDTNYNGTGYRIDTADGKLVITVRYGPPYPDPLSRVTPLISAIPVIELEDGQALSFPAQVYTANPALDPPDNLQTISAEMPKPDAETTVWFHVLAVSEKGQLGYKDHTIAASSSFIAVPITQTVLDGTPASPADDPVAPTGITLAVDNSAPDVYNLIPTWTLPTNIKGNVAYIVQFQFADTSTATLDPNAWTSDTRIDGKSVTTSICGPYGKQTYERYVWTRIKAVNGNNKESAWTVMSGSGQLVQQASLYSQPSDLSSVDYSVTGNETQFGFLPLITFPADTSAIAGYESQVRYFTDSGASTTPDSEWMPLGPRVIDDFSVYGLYPRSTYVTYTRFRARTINATGGYGNWVSSPTIGTVAAVSAPPAPTGVSFTIATSTKSGQPVFRPTITVSANTNLGTTENYLREIRFWNDSGLTNPDSDWIPLGSVYRTTLVSTTDWFAWDKATKYVRVRVAGENKDGTPGTYVTSSTVTLSASAGLDLSAADVSKIEGLEVASGKLKPKLDNTTLVIGADGKITQTAIDLAKAIGYDTSTFTLTGGLFTQKAIATNLLIAGMAAITTSFQVGGGSSNISITPTALTINSPAGSIYMSAGGMSFNNAALFNIGSANIGYLQVGSVFVCNSTGNVTAATLSLTSSPLAIGSGGTGSTTAAGARSNLGLGSAATMSIGTSAGTVAAGNDSRFGVADWASITGKPSLVNSVNGASGAVTVTAWTIGYTNWSNSNVADALDQIYTRLQAAGI